MTLVVALDTYGEEVRLGDYTCPRVQAELHFTDFLVNFLHEPE